MHPRVSRLSAALNRADFRGAWSRLKPACARGFPASIASLFAFTGDQDLLSDNPRAARLRSAPLKRALRELRVLPDGPERRALRAYALIAAGRYEEARRTVSAGAGGAPGRLLEAAALWLKCDEARSREWLADALDAADLAVAELDGHAARLVRAQIRFDAEDQNGGLEDLRAALSFKPRDMELRLGKIEGLVDARRCAPALAEFSRLALAARPPWWLLAQRGRVRALCGRLKEALTDLDEALRRRPGCGALYAWRAEARRKSGDSAGARADLARARALDPRQPLTWELSGRLSLEAGDYRRAERELSRACRLAPGRTLCRAWRAQARLGLGRLADAEADFSAILPMNPAHSWILPESAIVRGKEARREALASALDEAVLRALKDARPRRLRGWLRAYLGDMSGGLLDLDEAVASCRRGSREHAACLAWRGWTRLRGGDASGAHKDLMRALRAVPSERRWRAWLGLALLRDGQRRQALAQLAAPLSRPEPALAEVYLERGRVLSELGRREDARRDLKLACVLRPPYPEARRELARLDREAA